MVFPLITVFVSAIFLTYLFRMFAARHLLDVPNHRSSHQDLIPKGGGVAIVITFSAGAGWLFLQGLIDMVLIYAVLICISIALIGLVDDYLEVSARYRFLLHFIAAVSCLYLINGLPELFFLGFRLDLGLMGYVVGSLSIVWLLNLYNFMDGIDGLAASEAIFVTATLAAITQGNQPGLSFFAMILTMACCGFLFWNWPRASIFMGDVGSGFIGILLALIIFAMAAEEPRLLVTSLILYGIFILDASYTLSYRFVTGQKWYAAHCTHAYQKAAKKYGHLKVIIAVWGINMVWLLPWALMSYFFPAFNVIILVMAYLPLLYLADQFEAGRCNKVYEYNE